MPLGRPDPLGRVAGQALLVPRVRRAPLVALRVRLVHLAQLAPLDLRVVPLDHLDLLVLWVRPDRLVQRVQLDPLVLLVLRVLLALVDRLVRLAPLGRRGPPAWGALVHLVPLVRPVQLGQAGAGIRYSTMRSTGCSTCLSVVQTHRLPLVSTERSILSQTRSTLTLPLGIRLWPVWRLDSSSILCPWVSTLIIE